MSNEIESLVLSEIFSIRHKIAKKIRVCLFKNCLKICENLEETDFKSNLKSNLTIDLQDVIGSYVEEPYAQHDTSAYLIINTFEKYENNKRLKKTIELKYDKLKSKRENFKIVNNWQKNLELILSSKEQKPFLVFLNPNSGSGKAGYLFIKHASKLWNLANLTYHVIDTLYPNHAKECVQTIDLSQYRAIVVVSGDGLVYEILNGLFSRPDWEKAIKIPLGQIPAGSANGFSSSIAFSSGENYLFNKIEHFSTSMAFCLAKSKPIQMDLISINLKKNDVFINAFMNVEWAIVSDVDYESEKFRFLGGLRFIVGALNRIANLRVYKGRISFLPVDQNIQLKDPTIKIIKNTNNYKDENLSKTRLINKKLNYKYKYLKPFDEPVPNDWLSIEDEFVLFLVVNLPLMGVDFFVSPISKFDDGFLVLSFVKKGISKLGLLKIIDDASKGIYLDNPYLQFVKIKAFRLEPLDDLVGNIMVDGERVNYGPIQGEILPKFGNVLAMKN